MQADNFQTSDGLNEGATPQVAPGPEQTNAPTAPETGLSSSLGGASISPESRAALDAAQGPDEERQAVIDRYSEMYQNDPLLRGVINTSSPLEQEYYGAVASGLKKPEDLPSGSVIRAALTLADKVDSKGALTARSEAARLGLPYGVAMAAPEMTHRELMARQIEENVFFLKWAAETKENAAIARDNVDVLGRMFKTLQDFAANPSLEGVGNILSMPSNALQDWMWKEGSPANDAWKAINLLGNAEGAVLTGAHDFLRGAASFGRMMSENTFGENNAFAQWVEGITSNGWLKSIDRPKFDSFIAGLGYDAARALPATLASLAATYYTRNPKIGLAIMAAYIAGSDYEKFRKLTGPGKAEFASLFDAILQTPLEAISLGKMMKLIKTSGWKNILKAGGVAALTEGVTEAAQSFPEWWGDLIASAEKESGGEAWKQIQWAISQFTMPEVARRVFGDALYEGLVGALMGGIMGGGPVVLQMNRAKNFAEQHSLLHDHIEEAKQGIPGLEWHTMHDMLSQVRSINQDVYVSAGDLMQIERSSVPVLDSLGIDMDAAMKAEREGAGYRLNMASLHARLDKAQFDSVMKVVRDNPQGLSYEDATDGAGRVLQENVDRATEAYKMQAEEEAALRAELDRLRAEAKETIEKTPSLRAQVDTLGQGVDDYVDSWLRILEAGARRLASFTENGDVAAVLRKLAVTGKKSYEGPSNPAPNLTPEETAPSAPSPAPAATPAATPTPTPPAETAETAETEARPPQTPTADTSEDWVDDIMPAMAEAAPAGNAANAESAATPQGEGVEPPSPAPAGEAVAEGQNEATPEDVAEDVRTDAAENDPEASAAPEPAPELPPAQEADETAEETPVPVPYDMTAPYIIRDVDFGIAILPAGMRVVTSKGHISEPFPDSTGSAPAWKWWQATALLDAAPTSPVETIALSNDIADVTPENIEALERAVAYGEGCDPLVDDTPTSEAAEPEKAPDTRNYGTIDEPNTVAIGEYFADQFLEGKAYAKITDARKEVAGLLGVNRIDNGPILKVIDEAIELGVVRAARVIVAEGRKAGKGDVEIYRELVSLYERQPNLAVRTSTSVAQQAYSTPAPIAFLASRLAGITPQHNVYEPTAGNGMLVMEADPARVVANELNPDRAARLRSQGFLVTEKNAVDYVPSAEVDVVIENPPFGSVWNENHTETISMTVDDFTTKALDQAIVARSLQALRKDGNGRAVLIIGGQQATTERGRMKAYRTAAQVSFYKWLFSHYKVLHHVSIDGKLYSRQGASFPIDIIVLDNSGISEGRKFPGGQPPVMYSSFEELEVLLDEDVLAAGQPVSDADGVANGGTGGRGGVEVVSGSVDNGVVSEPGRPGEGGRGTDGGEQASDTNGSNEQPDGARPAEGGASDIHNAGDGRTSVDEGGSGSGSMGGTAELSDSADNRPGGDGAGTGEPVGRSDDSSPRGVVEKENSEPAPKGKKHTKQEDTQFQTDYEPASAQESMGTLVPKNMADAVRKAFDAVRQEHGDIDAFVADELGYPVEELGKYFAAEQVDAIALALHNIKNGDGFIIGDQTGIGKGRVNAAIIRWAARQGKTPVFITIKPDLYADMVRDLSDIGMEGFMPFATNASLTGNDAIRLPDGRMLKTPAAKKHELTMRKIVDEGLGDYGAVFTTYAQLAGKVAQRRRDFLSQLAPNAIFILDESHNAGGSQSNKKAGENSDKVVPVAQFIRDLLRECPNGVFYSSATYAKNPNVMDLYFKTGMRFAVKDIASLADAINRGGVPLQQVVAAQLAEAGQYLRRERTWEGADVETVILEADKERANKTSAALRSILDFDRLKQKAVDAADDDAAGFGGSASDMSSANEDSMSSTNFASLMHNVIAQATLAQKVDAIVQSADEALKRGEKPVIALSNTMGAFIEDYAKKAGLKPGEPVNLSFKDVYLRYLLKSRTAQRKEKNDKGKWEVVEEWVLSDEELGPEAVAAYNRAKELIETSGLDAMPASFIDAIKQGLKKRGYRVGEYTGRNVGIDYSGDEPVLITVDNSSITHSDVVDGFNSGDVDAVVLNSSGSTGISMHASEKFADQRRRCMIIAQADLNIDTFMQTLGRVFRTGQVVPPRYQLLFTDIPAEKRPAAVLSKKMASLNANTTAAKDSDASFKDAPDFLNKYGDEVAAQFVDDMPELHIAMGEPLIGKDGNVKREDAMRKLTGYIPVLSVEQQAQAYAFLESEYAAKIEQLEATGDLDLEAKVLPLDARLVSEEMMTPAVDAPGSEGSPFAQPAMLGTYNVKSLGKPWPASKVREMVAKGEQERLDPRELQAAHDDFMKKKLESIKDDKARENTENRIIENFNKFAYVLKNFEPGTVVNISTREGDMHGIVTSVQRKPKVKTENPLALSAYSADIAVVSSAKHIEFSFSQLAKSENASEEEESGTIVKPDVYGSPESVYRQLDAGQTVTRENVVIATGNLLGAFEALQESGKGRVIMFQTSDGKTMSGVLMPKGMDAKDVMADAEVMLTPEQGIQFLEALPADMAMVKTRDNNFRVAKSRYGGFNITIEGSKARGGAYFLNGGIIEALGHDFVKSGPYYKAEVESAEHLRKILDVMEAQGFAFKTDNNKDAARKITGASKAETEQTGQGKELAQVVRNDDATESPAQEQPSQITDNTLASTQNDGAFVGGLIQYTSRDDSYLITLFHGANLSTLLHETAHYFFEEMEHMALTQDADPKLVAEFDILRRWLGAEQGQRLNDRQAEQLAESMEEYLREGRSPSRSLADVFSRFRKWLTTIYRRVEDIRGQGMNLEITDEVRGVFDRLLAAEDEVNEAFSDMNLDAFIEDMLNQLNIRGSQREYLKGLLNGVKDKGVIDLMNKRNKEARLRRKQYMAEAKEEVAQDRLTIALADMRRTPLDLNAVREQFGDEMVAKIRKRNPGYLRRNGEDAQIFALTHGYESAEELLQDVAERGIPRRDAIRNLFNEKMAEYDAQHPADDALANTEELQKLLDLVGEYLARNAGNQNILHREFAAAAEKKLSEMTMDEAVKPGQYLTAMKSAILRERRAIAKGDFEAALTANFQSRLNLELYRQSRALREQASRNMRGIKRYVESLKANPVARFIVMTLAAPHGLCRRIQRLADGKDHNTVSAWFKSMEDQGYPMFIDPSLFYEGIATPWRAMTVEDYFRLMTAIRQVIVCERNLNKFLTQQERESLAETAEAISDTIHANRETKPVKTVERDSAFLATLKSAHAWHMKIENILVALDGGQPGVLWNAIYRPITEAEDDQTARLREVRENLKALMGMFSKQELMDMVAKRELVPEIGETMSRQERICVALNMGNEINRGRILSGHNWTQDQLDAVLKTLTEKDWKFVQAVWDYLETFREEAFRLHEEITGLRPSRVEPVPFDAQTADGKNVHLQGGYYPIRYNPENGFAAGTQEDKEIAQALFGGNNYASAMTKQGHLKERDKHGLGTPLLLDLRVLTDHIFNVVHDLAYRKAILDVAKIIRHKTVREAFESTGARQYYAQLMPWLQDIANERQAPLSPIHKMLNWARTSTTIMQMGLKATTIAAQPIGITQSIDVIGYEWVAHGLKRTFFSGHLAEAYRDCLQMSEFMRSRMVSYDRDVRDVLRIINTGVGVNGWIQKLRNCAFVPMGWAQMAVDLPTWWGAFDKSMKEHGDARKAALYADYAVRVSQGSGATKDLSRVQRGDPGFRLLTMFYCYFNTLYNLGATRIEYLAKHHTPADIFRAANSALLLWFIPAVLSELVAGRGPDDDDEGWLKWGAKKEALYPFQSMVGVRDVMNYILDKYGYQLTPAESAFKSIGNWFKAVDAALDGKGPRKPIKATAELTGYALRLPLKQLVITSENLYDLFTDPKTEFFVRDLFYIKPRSRQVR